MRAARNLGRFKDLSMVAALELDALVAELGLYLGAV
jgi:hypothetical protein